MIIVEIAWHQRKIGANGANGANEHQPTINQGNRFTRFNRGEHMSVYRIILTMCLALFLSSCATTPVLTNKNMDMSRKIKQSAPAVGKVAVSPDGRYVLSGGFKSVILWDILQGRKVQTFAHASGYPGITNEVIFSPDGKQFASGGKGVKLWDLATKEEIMTFDENKGISGMSFSPDGRNIISIGGTFIGIMMVKQSMKIFDVTTGEDIKDFNLVNHGGFQVVYSPDGKYVLSCGAEDINLWNASTGKSIKKAMGLDNFFQTGVTSLSFSPDGKYFLAGGSDNSVRLWNAKNLSQLNKFVGHSGFGGVSSVAFSPDGKYALSAGWDSNVIIWDIASGSQVRVFSGAGSKDLYATSAKFSPNGKYVISAGDASTRIWDVSTGEEIASMIDFEDGEWIITTANGYYLNPARHSQKNE